MSSRNYPRPVSGTPDDDRPSYTRDTRDTRDTRATLLRDVERDRLARRKDSMRHAHTRPPLTPNAVISSPPQQSMPNPLLPSAPASPPTPAPSPTPHQRPAMWNNEDAEETESSLLLEARLAFSDLSLAAKKSWLTSIVDTCDSNLLSFLHQIVSPRLKKDPFHMLPNEICFKILEVVGDPKSLARASRVSKRWREVLDDGQAWKALYEKHQYRRDSDESSSPPTTHRQILHHPLMPWNQGMENVAPAQGGSNNTSGMTTPMIDEEDMRAIKRPKSNLHRQRFKHQYMIESAWRKGGRMTSRHITPDQGVVTSLHLTKKYIVVALDNAKIHVFSTEGDHQRTLAGHVMGVWAMVPWDDTLVSGGCDRDVRVWDMSTGMSVHILRGHTSTVRCLKMSDAHTAISGSRDTTIRVWNIRTGICINTFVGHSASVRCLEVHGDLVVSGSYDTTARIWSLSTGQCLRTLIGHFSQIYAIAFDGNRIATGSLDTSVRIWDAHKGINTAILQGHTSLVGQLQMRNDTLVTGGSDGSVRVWSLSTFSPIHRLAAHDNSVTSLQFDDARIVSGGSDGRVKIWDLATGQLIRELCKPADAVWRVAFKQERAVVMACRKGKTIMEVWDFAPLEDEEEKRSREVSADVSNVDDYEELWRLSAVAQHQDVEMKD